MSLTILGKRPALAAVGEKQVFSSPNSVLISPCEHPNDLWTQPKVSSEEKASRLPPIRSLFFHHYDWNRWFASLATTVDNTIKMADRSFKHGRQWCIRRIGTSSEATGDRRPAKAQPARPWKNGDQANSARVHGVRRHISRPGACCTQQGYTAAELRNSGPSLNGKQSGCATWPYVAALTTSSTLSTICWEHQHKWCTHTLASLWNLVRVASCGAANHSCYMYMAG